MRVRVTTHPPYICPSSATVCVPRRRWHFTLQPGVPTTTSRTIPGLTQMQSKAQLEDMPGYRTCPPGQVRLDALTCAPPTARHANIVNQHTVQTRRTTLRP